MMRNIEFLENNMALDKDTLKDAIEDALGGDDPAKIAKDLSDAIDEYVRGMEITLKVTGKAAKDVKVEQEEIE